MAASSAQTVEVFLPEPTGRCQWASLMLHLSTECHWAAQSKWRQKIPAALSVAMQTCTWAPALNLFCSTGHRKSRSPARLKFDLSTLPGRKSNDNITHCWLTVR